MILLPYVEVTNLMKRDGRNQPEVRKALGVSKERTFESCNMQVNQAFQFQGDVSHNTAALIPPLLEDGIRVLIYAGDADFMVRPYFLVSLLSGLRTRG